MSTVSTTDPSFRGAVDASITTLRRLADYEIPPSLDARLRELAERKDLLSSSEHDELLTLVEFAQHRTMEKLEAKVALDKLHRALPDLVIEP